MPGAVEVPAGLRRAGVVVTVEGILLAAFSAAYSLVVLAGHPDSTAVGLTEGLLGVAVGLLLMVAGWALGRGRRAAFSPVLLAQLLAVPVGVGLVQAGRILPGVLIVLLAVGVILVMFGSSASRSTMGGQSSGQ